MHIRDLSGKRICVLGYGREGAATLNALRTYAPKAHITVADADATLNIPSVELRTGTTYLADLNAYDVIIVSPGIPPKSEFAAVRKKITSATQIFLDSVKDTGATVIGVTGSKGKSTTSSLIHAILSADGRHSLLVGNIGRPALDELKHANKNTFFVQEMSSYQLKDLTVSPEIAVLTTFFPEHLDYHGSLSAYFDAKAQIVRHQTSTDTVFFNAENDDTARMAKLSPGQKVEYARRDAPVSLDDTQLIGEHNLLNIAGAWRVAESLGVSRTVAMKAICAFRGLPHRLERIGTFHGIEWVDDAISTTPEAAIAALDALKDRVSTLILGGQDRGSDVTGLAKRIKESSTQHIILIGETATRMHQALEAAKVTAEIHAAASMTDVIAIAKKVTPAGTICLLSTAAPSYDMFKNFEEKGELFQKLIKE